MCCNQSTAVQWTGIDWGEKVSPPERGGRTGCGAGVLRCPVVLGTITAKLDCDLNTGHLIARGGVAVKRGFSPHVQVAPCKSGCVLSRFSASLV